MIGKFRDIVFSSANDNDEDIYTIDINGKNLSRLTQTSDKGVSNRTPEWSPSGKSIAFQSNCGGNPEIYILNLVSKEYRKLTDTPDGSAHHPAWSPDGKTIAYVADTGKGFELYTIKADGTNQTKISLENLGATNIFNPCFGQSSKYIYFVLEVDIEHPDQLWRIDLDGSNPKFIGPEGLSIFEFDISTSDNTIVFDAKTNNASHLGDWDIYTMNSDGSNIKRLTSLKAMSSRPKWLSDGKTIVFHSNRFGKNYHQPSANDPLETWIQWWNQFEICIMDERGDTVMRLTNNKLRDLHPDG